METPIRQRIVGQYPIHCMGESNRLMKGELEELGEEVDDKIESVSKIQTQILNLTHGKVNIFEDDGSFKNITQIMRELAAVQGELSDTESAELLELIAGKSSCPDVQKCA